ncbi:MAG: hypothetical protein H6R05_215 [Burkholderiaceae bacterium]|nr:hypothetical protein [Burkholderiaceae bacterium]
MTTTHLFFAFRTVFTSNADWIELLSVSLIILHDCDHAICEICAACTLEMTHDGQNL